MHCRLCSAVNISALCFLRRVAFGFFTSVILLMISKDVFRISTEVELVDATDAPSVSGGLKGVSSSWTFTVSPSVAVGPFQSVA
jgi:hypothetical protein